jgi:hypothetical protein
MIFGRWQIYGRFFADCHRVVHPRGKESTSGVLRKTPKGYPSRFILDNRFIKSRNTGGGPHMNDATVNDQLPIQIAPGDRLPGSGSALALF